MTLHDARALAFDTPDTVVVDVEESPGPVSQTYPYPNDDDEDEDMSNRIQLLGPDGHWHRPVGTMDTFACTGAPRLASTAHRPNAFPSTEAKNLCPICFTPKERELAAENDQQLEEQRTADYERTFGRPRPPRK